MREGILQSGWTNYKVIIKASPFSLELQINGTTVLTANAHNLLNYEEYRSFNDTKRWAKAAYDATKYERKRKRLWLDRFKDRNVSVPWGPSSVGLDFDFPLNEQLIGVPEHCYKLALDSTRNTQEPYRLFNTDIYDYEADSKMPLYGALPYLLSVSRTYV